MYERRRKVMETDTIIHNDCLDALKDMPSESAGRQGSNAGTVYKETDGNFFGSLPCTQGGRNLLAEYFRHILRYGEQRGL
jgi:hypothetical protein